jgi:iron complex transport system permease protein
MSPRVAVARPAALPDPLGAEVIVRQRSREAIAIVALGAALLGTFLLSLALGSVRIPVSDVVAVLTGKLGVDSSTIAVVILNVRLPRSITAMLAGAALGVAGLQMQTLFRNPLADPFVLGISSGASLGVRRLGVPRRVRRQHRAQR